MKSCARTVLRPFALARFAACSSSQYMYSFRALNASPAVLQPAFLSTPFALLAMTSDSSDFLAIFDLRIEGLSSDCRSFYLRGRNRSEEHTSELQSRLHLVCRLLLEKKKKEK